MDKIFLVFVTTLLLTTVRCGETGPRDDPQQLDPDQAVPSRDDPQQIDPDHTEAESLLYTSFPTSPDTASPPKPCCWPRVWQGIMYQYLAAQDIEYFKRVYYDGYNQTYAEDMVGTRGNGGISEKSNSIYQMDSTGTTVNNYYYDKMTGECTVRQFNQTYDQITERCIPEDAVYNGQFSIGIPDGGYSLTVHSWKWIPDPELWPGVVFERVVTSDCAPVLEISRGTLPSGRTTLWTHKYYNISKTISDRSVLDLPDSCTTLA